MKRAVFLDRDGTINVDIGYLADPNNLVLIHGSKEGVRFLKDNGFLIFIITNQSGVGRGYFSLAQLHAVNERLLNELSKSGLCIDDVYYCPHHPDDKCDCRKPSIKILMDIVKKYNINLNDSYFVGDKLLDVKTGKNAGCKAVLIDADMNCLTDVKGDSIQPDYVARNLQEAASWIVKNSECKDRE